MKQKNLFVLMALCCGLFLALTACNLSDIFRTQTAETSLDTRVTLRAKSCPPNADSGVMEKTQQIVQQRLTGLGIANAKVEVQDACQLVIDLAAPDNLEQLLETVRQTGRLEFVDVGSEFYVEGTVLRTTGNPSPTLTVANTFIPDKVYQAIVTGADLLPDKLGVMADGNSQPQVTFQLNTTAAERFKEFTTQASQQQSFLCIMLDNVVQSCPAVRSPIPSGEGVITVGQGGVGEAQRLLNLLRFGSLPHELEVIQSESLPSESK
jgi:preprotein translocase subunit SecD